MKIKTRDLGWLAAGFLAGILFAVLLNLIPVHRPVAPASKPVAAAPVGAEALLQPSILIVTNFQRPAPTFRIFVPTRSINAFEPESPWSPLRPRSVDLIDTRYPPEVKLERME